MIFWGSESVLKWMRREKHFCVNYPDIPKYRPIYNQLRLHPMHQQHYPNRLYSSKWPIDMIDRKEAPSTENELAWKMKHKHKSKRKTKHTNKTKQNKTKQIKIP